MCQTCDDGEGKTPDLLEQHLKENKMHPYNRDKSKVVHIRTGQAT